MCFEECVHLSIMNIQIVVLYNLMSRYIFKKVFVNKMYKFNWHKKYKCHIIKILETKPERDQNLFIKLVWNIINLSGYTGGRGRPTVSNRE